jgi:hydrophobic/amphiphilic exporter-1 (mainly G- bacteria), HAE1 family
MQIEQIVKKEIIGYKDIILRIGKKGFMGFLGTSDSHKGNIMITLPSNPKRGDDNSSEIKNKMRKHFNDFPAVIFTFQNNMQMGGSASPIDIIIKSNDLKRARDVAYKIKDLINEKVPEVTEPKVNLKEGLPQL